MDSLAKKLLEIDQALYAHEWAQQEALVAAYKESLHEMRNSMGAVYRKYAEGGKLKVGEMVQYKRQANLERQVTGQLKALGQKTNKITRKALVDGFSESYYRTGWGVETFTGIDMRFGVMDPEQLKAALVNPMSKIKWTESAANTIKQLNAQLKSTISTSIIQGRGYVETNKIIGKQMNMAANRSMRILRTETHRAQVQGRISSLDRTATAAERLGLKMTRSWSSTSDLRTRDTHVTMHGQQADKDNRFHLPTGGSTDGPGLSGIPEEDINCRCSIVAAFPELEGEAEFEPGQKIEGSNLYCLI